jgi:succinoglycan biosynthesis transport protein ExoP
MTDNSDSLVPPDDDDANDAPPPSRAAPDRALLSRRPRQTQLVERRRAQVHEPMPMPAPTAEDAAFAWLPYLIFFLRRRWPSLAGGMALCVGLALLYVLTATPQFTATTQLLVDIRRADLLSQQHDIEDSQTLNSELESRVEILRSEGLAREVVKRLNLQNAFAGARPSPLTAWLRALLHPAPVTPTGDPAIDQATLRLMQMTSVRRIGLTYVIEISVTSPSGVQSAQLANALVDTYLKGQLSAQDQVTRQAGQWMEQRLNELRDQAMAAGAAVERYKADKKIIGGDKGLLNEQQLGQLNTELVAAQQRSAAAKAMADQARAALGGDLINAGQSNDLKSTIISTLRTTYLDDAQRAARWTAAYGPNNAQVVKLRGEMQQIELSIRSELQRIASSYQNDENVAEANEKAIEGQLAAITDQTVRTNSDRVELSSLQSSADTYRTVYENFLNRYTQAVQDESFPVSEARVITTAVPPLRKSAPHGTVAVVLGAFAGLAGGFVVAFTREMLDQRLRTREQLRAATGLICIGQLPPLELDDPPQAKSHPPATGLRVITGQPNALRAVVQNPHSDFVQALRALQARLTRGVAPGEDIRLIGFVPAGRGEGSTTIAANFAQFLASCGHHTALVDLNIDDDRLSRALAPDAPDGLLQALAHPNGLHKLIWRDAETGVEFLPLGRLTARAQQSTMMKVAELVFERLAATHDYVVVDLPPLSPAVEAHGLANLLDGFVLVVDWASVHHDVLADRMLNTGLDPSKFVGAVYDKVDFAKLRKYVSGASASPGWA